MPQALADRYRIIDLLWTTADGLASSTPESVQASSTPESVQASSTPESVQASSTPEVCNVPLLIGTSGWQYRDWRGTFYPAGVPAARWLECYAATFPTVENNGTFYRLAPRETFEQWRKRTPDGFVMAVKASRYLSHIRRLRDSAEPVARLLAAATGLGDRLGPVLLQLPPTMQAAPSLLDECLHEFSAQHAKLDAASERNLRVCVEFRHQSWETQEVRAILERHNAALCWSDRLGRPLGPLWRTASWGYLRLHEGAAQPWPRYGPQSLRSWLARIAAEFSRSADYYVYFNNDQHGAAPADAAALQVAADHAGWPVARPAAGSSSP
jgi:uncharacterized protein YecE (DUF72 family)